MPTASLRYFTVYGPRQRPDMAFTRFCHAVRDGREIEMYGDGEQVRDFTYVDDVVEANLRVAETADLAPGSVLNVAGGSSTTVNEVLELLGEISGREVRAIRGAPVPGDVLRTGGSTRRDPEGDGVGAAHRAPGGTRGAVQVGRRRSRMSRPEVRALVGRWSRSR